MVGLIYDTLLVNPEYGSLGPRLSPPAELSVLSPDYLNEQGVLVGVLLLGWRDAGGTHHTVPRRVIPVGQEIFRMADDDVLKFLATPRPPAPALLLAGRRSRGRVRPPAARSRVGTARSGRP